MPFSRPTLAELAARTRNDTVSSLPNPDLLRRNNADVMARVMAGAAHSLYGYIEWLSRQLIYDTADGDILERWASIWGISRKPATAAAGNVTITGTNGAIVPDGTELAAGDGTLYATTAAVTIASGSALAAVQAVTSGAVANRESGELLSLQSAISGINATATAGALTGGADLESDDALRGRLLARIKTPPHGGARSDYEAWSLEVPGVTRAWVSALELGAGTVVVRFMMDDTYPDGIPLSGDVTAVAAHIEPLRPVTANVTVAAPVAVPLNFSIAGLSPATTAVQTAVEQELTDLIAREAAPGGILLLSHINEAISVAAGEWDHQLSVPAANVSNAAGYITTMGTITWL